jgi:NAD(P) transhydrogenase
MNRSLINVLFGGISTPTATETKIEGTITKTTVDETVESLTNADNVILVCCLHVDLCSPFYTCVQVVGYGMAVAKAQYAISEITALLRSRGINVRVCSRA